MKIGESTKIGLLFLMILASGLYPAAARPENTVVYDCAAEENREKATTVEILLANKWKGKVEEVKQSFTSSHPGDAMKIRVKFFPFLDPPKNIGIGKCVTAENARLSIREAVKYNGKIDRLLVQEIMPHHWIKIGTTDTSEIAWIPVKEDDLAQLTDPALSTDQFHELYRRLAWQKEKRRPFGMDSEKREANP